MKYILTETSMSKWEKTAQFLVPWSLGRFPRRSGDNRERVPGKSLAFSFLGGEGVTERLTSCGISQVTILTTQKQMLCALFQPLVLFFWWGIRTWLTLGNVHSHTRQISGIPQGVECLWDWLLVFPCPVLLRPRRFLKASVLFCMNKWQNLALDFKKIHKTSCYIVLYVNNNPPVTSPEVFNVIFTFYPTCVFYILTLPIFSSALNGEKPTPAWFSAAYSLYLQWSKALAYQCKESINTSALMI